MSTEGHGDVLRLTTKQFAAKLGTTYAVAQGLMKFLRVSNVAVDTGEKDRSGGNIRAAAIFAVPQQITINLQ